MQIVEVYTLVSVETVVVVWKLVLPEVVKVLVTGQVVT